MTIDTTKLISEIYLYKGVYFNFYPRVVRIDVYPLGEIVNDSYITLTMAPDLSIDVNINQSGSNLASYSEWDYSILIYADANIDQSFTATMAIQFTS